MPNQGVCGNSEESCKVLENIEEKSLFIKFKKILKKNHFSCTISQRERSSEFCGECKFGHQLYKTAITFSSIVQNQDYTARHKQNTKKWFTIDALSAIFAILVQLILSALLSFLTLLIWLTLKTHRCQSIFTKIPFLLFCHQMWLEKVSPMLLSSIALC